MKRKGFILIAVFLVAITFAFEPAGAQEKSKEEREREQKIQQEIDHQKKAIEKARIEQKEALEDQKLDIEKAMKEAQEQIESADRYTRDRVRVYRGTGDRSFYSGEPFVFTPDMSSSFGHSMLGDSERTTWDFSKSIRENSFSRDYTFDVEPTAKTVVMSVNGDCKAGEIRIKILMPNGKTYSDIVLDEFGNLNWRKSFAISEEENKDKAGAWKFQINASKATGYFKISLQTY